MGSDRRTKQKRLYLKASLFAPEKRKISLPYITRRFGAEVTFDTLSYNMTKDKRASNQLLLKGKAESERT